MTKSHCMFKSTLDDFLNTHPTLRTDNTLNHFLMADVLITKTEDQSLKVLESISVSDLRDSVCMCMCEHACLCGYCQRWHCQVSILKSKI